MTDSSTSQRPGEDDLIANYFAPIAGPAGLGLKDDAACLSPPAGHDLVVTVDGLVAGVHFFAEDRAGDIARKALRVNLSDLAAKGAKPLGFLLTLALPPDWTAQWLQEFADGLGDDAARYECPLIGGDTVKTPGPLTLSITAFGAVPRGRMARRAAVRPGDFLYVSGEIGDAAIGLRLRLGEIPELSADADARLRRRYLLPEPRLALRDAMTRHASGGMDVSDGFVGDLTKMLKASGVGGEIDLDKLPLSFAAAEAIARNPALFQTAVTGGDDYEVLASVAPENAAAFETSAREAGVSVARVGVAGSGGEMPKFLRDGRAIAFGAGSFSHF